MIKPSVDLQELRRRIYRKAKADKTWRFWGLYVHVCKIEILRVAYQEAKANDGAPGLDGVSFESIEARGVQEFLKGIQEELLTRTYKPSKNRRVEIPKGNGKTRRLGIPTIKDGLVQGLTQVIDVDLKGYFDNIRHHILLRGVAERVEDPEVLHLVKRILKANGKKGVPQGGVLSPLLANVYLNEL